MATFNWEPTYSIAVFVEPRILRAPFGDGYVQRGVDGLNSQGHSWDLTFIGDSTTINAIEQFLLDTGGYDSFDWTPPSYSSSKKFVYTNYSKSARAKVFTLTANFIESFDLA